jgi:hypothetical protein
VSRSAGRSERARDSLPHTPDSDARPNPRLRMTRRSELAGRTGSGLPSGRARPQPRPRPRSHGPAASPIRIPSGGGRGLHTRSDVGGIADRGKGALALPRSFEDMLAERDLVGEPSDAVRVARRPWRRRVLDSSRRGRRAARSERGRQDHHDRDRGGVPRSLRGRGISPRRQSDRRQCLDPGTGRGEDQAAPISR